MNRTVLAWMSLLCVDGMVIAGCTAPKSSDTGGGSDSARSDDTEPPGPCGDGGWGEIGDPGTAIFVQTSGSDTDGDGSYAAPLASLDAAVALARDRSAGSEIGLGPGTFPATLTLQDDDGSGRTDSGLSIHGCGVDETRMEAADAAQPVIHVVEATGLDFAGFEVLGGRPGLSYWGGAEAKARRVRLTGPALAGIRVIGTDTLIDLEDVDIADPVAEDSDGISLGVGAVLQDGRLTVKGGRVKGARTVAVLVDGASASISLEDFEIDGTLADDDLGLGRGLQVQGYASAEVTHSTFTENADASIFAWRSLSMTLTGNTIDGTQAGGGEGGDGIVITQLDEGEATDTFVSTITDNVITGSSRAGVLIDGTSAVLDGNTAGSDNGLFSGASAMFAQRDAEVSGDDVSAGLVNTLDDASSLDLNSTAFDLGIFEP